MASDYQRHDELGGLVADQAWLLAALPASQPLDVLTAIKALRGLLAQLEDTAVDIARDQEPKVSWGRISEALGVARQTAHEKHRKRHTGAKPPPKEH